MSAPMNEFESCGLIEPGRYSLQIGAPCSEDLKIVSGYLEAASKRLYQQNRFEETLQYGVSQGGESVLKEVANFLTRQYQSPVNWENIFITSGASSGLEVLIQHYFTPDQIMFAENPTYPVFAITINRDQVMKGVPIPIQSDGMDLEYFERELEKLPNMEVTAARPYCAAVYLISTHHNPTGCCYSPEKCRRLIKLARKFDLLIICDDVYNTLNYVVDDKNPDKFLPSPPRLFSYDDKNDPDYKGNVVSNGSFAKIVAPGLRMGWYEAPEHIVKKLVGSYLLNSGGGQSSYISYVVAEALKSGQLDDYVQHLRCLHKPRMEAVIGIVEKNLAKYGVTISHPNGGYFLWLKMPQEIDSERVAEIALANEKVTFVKGYLASLRGEFRNCIRLSIAYYQVEQLKDATERLCRAIVTAINEKRKL